MDDDAPAEVEPPAAEESSDDLGHVDEMIADLSPEERKRAYDLLCKEFDHSMKEYAMKDFEA